VRVELEHVAALDAAEAQNIRVGLGRRDLDVLPEEVARVEGVLRPFPSMYRAMTSHAVETCGATWSTALGTFTPTASSSETRSPNTASMSPQMGPKSGSTPVSIHSSRTSSARYSVSRA